MVGGRGKDIKTLEAVKEDIEMSWTSSDEDDEEVLASMTERFVLLNFTSFLSSGGSFYIYYCWSVGQIFLDNFK